MKISVVGNRGIVGSATQSLFEALGYNVSGADIGEIIPKADIYFICTHEKDAEGAISVLPEGLAVVRSSTMPFTCERLSAKYNRHICHNPEFLHQSSALVEEFNPPHILIGECCRDHGQMVEDIYRPMCRPVFRSRPEISEMVKIARNNYGAAIISFWNEISDVCKVVGINPHQVGMLCSLDPIVADKGSRLHKSFEGKCLPKDLDRMIDFAQLNGIDPRILKAVREVNDDRREG